MPAEQSQWQELTCNTASRLRREENHPPSPRAVGSPAFALRTPSGEPETVPAFFLAPGSIPIVRFDP